MSRTTVTANHRTLVHADSGGRLVTTDVCLTTTGSSVVPVPYTNLAHARDAAGTAASVQVCGHPVCTERSRFARSEGDESGDQGGVVSGVTTGEATFLPGGGSEDVWIEGAPVVRALDPMVSNRENTPPEPLLQEQAASAPVARADPPPEPEPLPRTVVEVGGGPEADLPGELILEPEQGGWHRGQALAWAEHDGDRWRVAFRELPEGADRLRLSLLDLDRRHDYVKIPLTLGERQPAWARGSEPDERPPARYGTVLVPTLVRFAADAALEHRQAGHGHGGWLYLFRRRGGARVLWRELYVHPTGRVHEVNLAYAGGDERPPTGEGRAVVLLPLQVAGEPVALEAAFSTVQWPWARIEACGGLAPDDPRAGADPGGAPAATPDTAPGDSRLFSVDLSGYAAGFPGEWGHVGSSGAFREADPGPGEPAPVREDLSPFAEDGLAVLYLDDPLGEARRLAREQAALSDRLEAEVAALQTGLDPDRLAAEGEPDEAPEATAEGDGAQRLEAVEALHRAAAGTYRRVFVDEALGAGEVPPDRELLERLLGCERRRAYRRAIQEVRRRRLELLSSERYAAALADYAGNTPRRVFEGVAAVVDHLKGLAEPADAADSYIADAPEAEQRADAADRERARALLEAVLRGRGEPAALAAVAARLLAPEPLVLGTGARGVGLPRHARDLERQHAEAPRRIRELERACDRAEQRSALQAEEVLTVVKELIGVLAEPVAEHAEVIEEVHRVVHRFRLLPGMAPLGEWVVATGRYRAPVVDGVPLDRVQSLVAGPKGERDGLLPWPAPGVERSYRVLAAPGSGYAVLAADAGRGPIRIIGRQEAVGAVVGEVHVRELRLARHPEHRIADLADRLEAGPGGQALRLLIGALEAVNVAQALQQAGEGERFHILNAAASGLHLAELAAQARLADLRRRAPAGDPRRARMDRLARRANRYAAGAALADAAWSGHQAVARGQRRDHAAAAAHGAAGVAHLSAAALLAGGVPGVGTLLLIAGIATTVLAEELADSPLGDFCRNGPFAPGRGTVIGAAARGAGWEWVRAYASLGPVVDVAPEQGSWSDWPEVARWWRRAVDPPPLAAAYRSGRAAGPGPPDPELELTLTLARAAWRRGDAIDCRVLRHRRDGGCQELPDLVPAQAGLASEDGDRLGLTLVYQGFPLPSREGEALDFLIRHRVMADDVEQASLPERDADGTPRYWVARLVREAGLPRETVEVLPTPRTPDELGPHG